MTDTFTTAVIPAKAGIHTIVSTPTQWDNTLNTALSAARSYMTSWIPAFAGMTEPGRVGRDFICPPGIESTWAQKRAHPTILMPTGNT